MDLVAEMGAGAYLVRENGAGKAGKLLCPALVVAGVGPLSADSLDYTVNTVPTTGSSTM
jgi:hypothetical protein|eukprot:COSAG05_NODE_1659_length_4322_cov_1019.871892_3_plen_59_part_00